MAGGEGSRLRPLTCTIPKPMARIFGRPMIEYVFELLRCHGVDEAAVTLGYLPHVIEALKRLKTKCNITIYTDSKYVAEPFLQGWIWGWMKNGWKKADKKPVLNPDLWQTLVAEIRKHEYHIVWVKGHAGHPENERCDKLATAKAIEFANR